MTRDRKLRDACRRNQTLTIHVRFGLVNELVTPSINLTANCWVRAVFVEHWVLGSRAEADALLAELKCAACANDDLRKLEAASRPRL